MPDCTVTHLHTRRRDDAPAVASDTLRSTPAFAVPLPLPFDNDEPFADALLAQARAKRLHAAKVALAQREEDRLQAEQLRNNQLNEAHRAGYAIGLGHGFTRGWYWGLCFGAVLASAITYLCIKASALL